MRYRQLGRTGLKCSEVSLGTWSFASNVYGDVSRDEAIGAVRAALDAGINTFDTAPLYGTAQEDGIAEVVLGEALGADRDEVIIATKFGRLPTEPIDTFFNAAGCRASVEASLRRLQRDHIDILFFHSPFGPEQIHDDVWEGLTRLRTEGKVRFVGHSISLFDKTEGMARAWAADGRIDVVQAVLSLLNRESVGLIAELGNQGIGVVARESLANGFLSGKITRDTVFAPNNLNGRYTREEVAERVEEIERLSFLVRPPVASMPQAALRWVLDNPGVSTVLAGSRNGDEILDCAAVSDLPAYTGNDMARARAAHARDFSAA
ncbi:MAG: aldo/keto reductase [Candidatus Dormibacteria bacterium]